MKIENISEFTIYEVEKIKPILLEELKNSGDIEIDMSEIEKIDMVGVQLILSFMKSAKKKNKKVKLRNLNEAIMTQMKVCKYDLVLGIDDE